MCLVFAVFSRFLRFSGLCNHQKPGGPITDVVGPADMKIVGAHRTVLLHV